MRKSTLILLIILILSLVASGIYYWLNQDKVKSIFNKNTATSNVNNGVNSNLSGQTNTTPITSRVTELVEGDKKLEATLKIGDLDLKLTGYTVATTFESITVAKGKKYVIVYFQSVVPTQVFATKRGLEQDTRVVSGQTSYDLAGLKVASNIVTDDRGYLKFVVDETAKNLQLEVGSGTSAQIVKLP